MGECKVIIGGDICPTNRNEKPFLEGDIDALFQDLKDNFKSGDLNIINLECPLISKNTSVHKLGPVLGANVNCVRTLKKLGIDVANIGNNHIMDHGKDGLDSTIKTLINNGIKYVGADKNKTKAKEILSIVVKNFKIGILSIVETEFHSATENGSGTNQLDIIDIIANLKENKNQFDFIIALIHGGLENYPFPSPKSQKFSRFLIEQGVGCVIWQHSHCAGYIEQYKDKYIVYGQGNLLFDIGKSSMMWHKGYLVELDLDGECNSTIKLIPYYQSYNKIGINKMNIDESQELTKDIFSKMELLSDETKVKKLWEEYCMTERKWYLGEMIGYARLITRMGFLKESSINQKLLGILGINKDLLFKFRNLSFSESHQECMQTSITLYLDKEYKNKKYKNKKYKWLD